MSSYLKKFDYGKQVRNVIMESQQSKLMLLSYGISLILLNMKGIQMQKSAIFIIMALLGSYSVACMVKGKCEKLAWAYSVVPLLMIVTNYLQHNNVPFATETSTILDSVRGLIGTPSNLSSEPEY